jgi:hypothetical protein
MATTYELAQWRFFEVQQADRPDRTKHVAGSTGWHGDGQVSSAIASFDPSTCTATTESGSTYQLVGRGNGLGVNAQYVWDSWCRHAGATAVVDLTADCTANCNEHKP